MRKSPHVFIISFLLISSVTAMEHPCDSRTPTFRTDEVISPDSGAITINDISILKLKLEAESLDSKLKNKVESFLDKLEQFIQKGYQEVNLTNLREQRTAYQNLRKQCGKLMDIFKKLSVKSQEDILQELRYLYGRLLARENFYYRLAGIPYKHGKVPSSDDKLIFPPPKGTYREDAIMAWNPGYWSLGCLEKLLTTYKDEKTIGFVEPEHAFDFFSWGDRTIYNVRTKIGTLTKDDRILKTKCALRKDPSPRLSTGALRIIFDTNGKAYSPRAELSKEEKICQKVIFKVGQKPVWRYVYPLKEFQADDVFIYNINSKGELYVEAERWSKHVNILKGEPLLAAGVLKFKEGKISLLNNDSGHYKPRLEHVINACKLLKKNYGASIFHPDFVLQNYTPNEGMKIVDKSSCLTDDEAQSRS
ncbi:MAG TPA: hypothetical protein VNJ29_04190 [Candidatus Nitrosotenuis sp.]|nr:hypothetical protein [Candidatus Nitrosotenuis sp.]